MEIKKNIGVFTRPCLGERKSGDIAVVKKLNENIFLAIVDILGHGEKAHSLAIEFRDFLMNNCSCDVVDTMNLLNEKFIGHRGAAVGICSIDIKSGELKYTGIGNTIIRKIGKKTQELISRDGIVGIAMPTPKEEKMKLSPGDILLLYTDGVKSYFSLEQCSQILVEDVHTIAKKIIRRFGKSHDDASCIVLRFPL